MLTVAPGFSLDPGPLAPPAPETPRFGQADYHALLTSPGRWLLSLSPRPLAQPTDLTGLDPLLREFFIAQTVLAFQVPAAHVSPVEALGRVILLDYQPQRRPDPPVPLLALLPLDPDVIATYNRAIRHLLTADAPAGPGQGRLLARALPAVLHAGLDILTRAEAFYIFTKLTSLATGAYTQS